ncbi:LOW QUALITY PROTEIN: GDSL esterase/lipase At4g10955, partial [Eucalyptus grandis]|uniref:LOW QUALITY PROTEIN: GDSL esterase/lipase At4g10955 n=1 Tax=Eucalyptus grandis TaxID=71139 RepID=UPI00192F1059
HFVVTFGGTMTKKELDSRDIMLGLLLLQHGLHSTSRFETAMQAVRNMVATADDSRVWLAGHSLGSAIALLAGQNMAKTGLFLESFLFNPPYVPVLVEKIKNTKVKLGIRFTTSMITAGLMLAMKAPQLRNQSADSFATLSAWAPPLYVNAADHVYSEYIGYFEHRNKMQEIGPGAIEKLATQHSYSTSIGLLFMSAMGKQAEPLHLIPSANLSINLNPSPEYKRAHSIHQWWRHDLNLQSKVYTYS